MAVKKAVQAPAPKSVEHVLYENDHTLPDLYDVPLTTSAAVVTLTSLHAMIRAMQDRGMVVIVSAMRHGDDDGGARLTFSTHPDTITLGGAR